MSNTNIINPEMLNMLKSVFRIRAGWQSISSSVSVYQNGTITATVNEARYYLDDKIAHVVCHFSITAAGTTNNPIYILLPVFLTPAYASNSAALPIGIYAYHDSGTALYHAFAEYATTIGGLPAIGGYAHNVATRIGQTPNIAAASGDNVGINLTYRIN